jgi:hypothetical protein
VIGHAPIQALGEALDDSAEQASCLDGFEGDRKVPAHAQIFNLLTDAAADSVLAAQLKDRPRPRR